MHSWACCLSPGLWHCAVPPRSVCAKATCCCVAKLHHRSAHQARRRTWTWGRWSGMGRWPGCTRPTCRRGPGTASRPRTPHPTAGRGRSTPCLALPLPTPGRGRSPQQGGQVSPAADPCQVSQQPCHGVTIHCENAIITHWHDLQQICIQRLHKTKLGFQSFTGACCHQPMSMLLCQTCTGQK